MCKNCLIVLAPSFRPNQKKEKIDFEKKIRTRILKDEPLVNVKFVNGSLPTKEVLAIINSKKPSKIFFKTNLPEEKTEAIRAFVAENIRQQVKFVWEYDKTEILIPV